MAQHRSKRREKPTRMDQSSTGLDSMTDGTGKKRQVKPKSRRERARNPLSAGVTKLMEHPRMAGVRRFLDVTTRRLEALDHKIPAPIKNPVVQKRVAIGIVILGGAGLFRYAAIQVDQSLPDPAELKTFARPGTLTIRASDGSVLHQLGPATRDQVAVDRIPKRLIDAFVASEDRRFYDHNGLDLQGIGRAVFRNLTSRDVVEGGSTLTQQLSRVVFLDQDDRSLGRKVREALIAQKLERTIDKKQILEKYLNFVYLGSNAYGVADAAWIYFSKRLDQLTLGEMAMIAGLPPAPSLYSPLVSLEKAQERRNTVLDKMVVAGYISEAESQAAQAEKLVVKPSMPKNLQSTSPYFTYYVQQQLEKLVPKDVLAAGGVTVETTLNAKWQKVAERSIREAIGVDGNAEGFKQAALVAIDPRNGEIRSMVGGYDFYKDSQFNRVTQAQRQPGSTFKPFVYATAIATGKSPYQSYLDERFSVDGYQPKNYSNKYSGWLNMKTALTNSVNVIAVKVLIDVGFEPVIKLAQGMGIRSKMEPTYSLALGAYEVNPLELTSAYGVFAAQGNYVEPHAIRKVIDRKGKVLYDANYKPKRVLDAETAAITTWMMRGVVSDGTAQAARLDRPVAGKTGTSENARDLWFIGYVPQLVTGVWLGNDDNSPTWGSSGTAAFTWHEFMKEAVAGMPTQKFAEIPENLDDRKGTIKAQPVKPNRLRALGTAPDSPEEQPRRRYEEAPPEPTYSEPRYSEPEPPRSAPPEPEAAPPEPEAAPPEPEAAPVAPPPADPAPAAADPLPPPGN
ncbi:penicillin-binding protein 1A [Leptolyngbya sp. UWPOB_LEPTO1]|uniref:transglycosylase domain-containing protein n=1 Tax=Leptolyngbya sp. UWPOB_LEPTO1 TaxID=2815653 RepID=UPI00257FA42D|nr:penicillin-binding protein 1A [Leptolyngbya sp. UWPOB_LEPTO1]